MSCQDRKSTRLNSSHVKISYAVFCLKKKKTDRRCCSSQPQRSGSSSPPGPLSPTVSNSGLTSSRGLRCSCRLFFFNDTATTEIYTLSLHDALPISPEQVLVDDEGVSWDTLPPQFLGRDRKSTRLNSSHVKISYAVFCLKKKKN